MMAEFKPAFDAMIKHEIFPDGHAYANDPADKGGETYAGISRKFWPEWSGWKVLDTYKEKPHFGVNSELDASVLNFYKTRFWTPYRLSELLSQDVANYIFDKIMNCGMAAVKISQRIAAVPDDAKMGAKTIAAINGIEPVQFIASMRKGMQEHYKAIVARAPSQAKFLKSWLSRC